MYKLRFSLVIVVLFAGLCQSFARPDNRFRQPHSRNQFDVIVFLHSATRDLNVEELDSFNALLREMNIDYS